MKVRAGYFLFLCFALVGAENVAAAADAPDKALVEKVEGLTRQVRDLQAVVAKQRTPFLLFEPLPARAVIGKDTQTHIQQVCEKFGYRAGPFKANRETGLDGVAYASLTFTCLP